MAQKSKTPFDFENAEVGQPGPNGSPITDKYVNRLGIPVIETKPKPGFRTITVPLKYLYRQPLARVIPPPEKPEAPKRRPAKVAVMVAQANDLQRKLDRGEYRDQAEAAKALGMTTTSLTRLLDLALLAPDIQEKVLFMEAVDGKEPITERALREVVRHMSWVDQRRVWRAMKRKR